MAYYILALLSIFVALIAFSMLLVIGLLVVLPARRLDLAYLPAFAVCASADWLKVPTYVRARFLRLGAPCVLFTMGLPAGRHWWWEPADCYGRKRSCVIGYWALRARLPSKHFRSLPILLAGRVLSGAATFFLFTSFERGWSHSMRRAQAARKALGVTLEDVLSERALRDPTPSR